MPQTEGCPLGEANKARIEGLGERMDESDSRLVRYMDHTDKCIERLTNHYSKRLPHSIVLITILLTNLVTALVILYLQSL